VADPVAEFLCHRRTPQGGGFDDWKGSCAGHLRNAWVEEGAVSYWALRPIAEDDVNDA